MNLYDFVLVSVSLEYFEQHISSLPWTTASHVRLNLAFAKLVEIDLKGRAIAEFPKIIDPDYFINSRLAFTNKKM